MFYPVIDQPVAVEVEWDSLSVACAFIQALRSTSIFIFCSSPFRAWILLCRPIFSLANFCISDSCSRSLRLSVCKVKIDLLCWCFTSFRNISGHFGHGQLTYPHCSWASFLAVYQYLVHILSPVTDNCPSWISGRERTDVEIISWPISTKRMLPDARIEPSAYQVDADPTKLLHPTLVKIECESEWASVRT